MNNWRKFDETSLLENEDFYSYLNKEDQGLIQDLNLGSDMYVLSCCSMTNMKKYCRQVDLLCSVLWLV